MCLQPSHQVHRAPSCLLAFSKALFPLLQSKNGPSRLLQILPHLPLAIEISNRSKASAALVFLAGVLSVWIALLTPQ